MSDDTTTPVDLPTSNWFSPEEFACHDGTPYPVVWGDRYSLIVGGLCDHIRDLWMGPISVVSGYRSPAYNQHLIEADNANGVHQVASGSFHCQGMAADLRPEGVTPERIRRLHHMILTAYASGQLPNLGGLGVYPTSGWVHVDTYKAPDGHLRRWSGL